MGDSRNMRGNDRRAGYLGPPVPPLIGISTSEMRSPERTRRLAESDPPERELALGLSYPKAIELAGAVPVVLPPLDVAGVDAILDRLGGLVLSGGPDLHPSAYGAEPDPDLGPTEPDLDLWELALARRADALGLPILGICRGLQVLNVARGGSLVQDLPGHRQEESGRMTTHVVRVESGTRLAAALGDGEHAVNSFHHQAVERLGERLHPVAWSPDGLIEGLEAADRPFVLGVQWHAESLVGRPDQDALFAALVEAAALHETARGRVAAA